MPGVREGGTEKWAGRFIPLTQKWAGRSVPLAHSDLGSRLFSSSCGDSPLLARLLPPQPAVLEFLTDFRRRGRETYLRLSASALFGQPQADETAGG